MNNTENRMPERPGQGKPKKSRFRAIYWVYAAMLAFFLYLQFSSGALGGQRSYDATWHQVEQMLKRGDVENIVVVNNQYAEVFLKTDRLYADSAYEALRNPDGHSNTKFYVYKFLTLESFQQDVRKVQWESKIADTAGKSLSVKKAIMDAPTVEPVPETRKNFW